MKGKYFRMAILFIAFFGLLISTNALAVDKVVIGHPACLSGKYAKAGEQAIGGIKACIDWVNNVYGGVLVGGKRIPIEYKYYDLGTVTITHWVRRHWRCNNEQNPLAGTV